MAASKPVEPQTGSGLPRWQLALLVGTPIVLGVGAVYLWNRRRTKERKGTGERKTPEGSASPAQGQDGSVRASREEENMVTLTESPPVFTLRTPCFPLRLLLTLARVASVPCKHACG